MRVRVTRVARIATLAIACYGRAARYSAVQWWVVVLHALFCLAVNIAVVISSICIVLYVAQHSISLNHQSIHQ